MLQQQINVDSRIMVAPAALGQERLFFLHQCMPNNGVYNIPTILRFKGELNVAILRQALDRLIARHELLRSIFRMSNGGLRQIISDTGNAPFSFRDLRGALDREGLLLQALIREEIRKPFELESESVVRMALLQTADLEHVLIINVHHIACDEWSVRVMLSELKELYGTLLGGTEPSLPELPIQYADYAAWSNELLRGPKLREQIDFWKQALAGESSPTEVPPDHPRPRNPSYAGARERIALSAELSGAITELARAFQTTRFNVLYGAFQSLLARYTSKTDILSGTAVAGRVRSETEPLVGFFANLLPIRTRISETATFEQVLEEMREAMMNACSHQDVPFDRVIAEVNPERARNRTPLIQVVFTVQKTILDRDRWGPLEVEWMDADTGTSKFDLNVIVEDRSEQFLIHAEYSTELYDAETIQRFCRHYANLLCAMVEDPQRSVWSAPLLDSWERRQLLEDWNATEVPLPGSRTIEELFAQQVAAAPNAAALVFTGGEWSYAELDERANELASNLASLGSGPGVMIGLCLERSPELIAVLLAILKTGACYVPLDPQYPPERLRYLLEDAGAAIVVTNETQMQKVPPSRAQILVLGAAAETLKAARSLQPRSADAPAYIMYTSGSTGKPKGVVVMHRNVVLLVKGVDYVSVGRDEVFLQYAPIAFDASTFEIWAPLLNGGKLCIMPPAQVSLEDLGAAISRFKVTTLWLTAGLFNLAVDECIECFRGLRQLLTGGEIASLRHFRKFLEQYPDCKLFNAYGPTENTTFTTVARVQLEDLDQGNVTIGRPISNTKVYILDQFLQPVPIGVHGEIYAGGEGVAREYLNAPELTRQKFIASPFKTGERLYRTGDLARFRPDGNIQFLGRVDHQVKIRGFRVELGEIEEVVRSHPAVREAVVITAATRPCDKGLIAYWSAVDPEPSVHADDLRAFLRNLLPEFMVPSTFVRVDRFLLDANGKIDRNALPALARMSEIAPTRPPEPASLEEKLLGIWRQIFSQPNIGLDDDFFDLGGHSLLATQMVSRIRQTLRMDLSVGALFDHGTVSELARFLRSRPPQRETPPISRTWSPGERIAGSAVKPSQDWT